MKENKEETKLQSEQKTLQQCKEEVARDCGFQDWEHIVESYNPKKLVDLTDEVAELYASQFKSQLPIEQKDEEIVALKQELRRVIHEKDKEISALKSQPLPIEGVGREWISVKDRPLFTKDEKGRWIATNDGENEFMAALRYHENGKGEKWWIRHCVIQDIDGLCVVGDDCNEPAGWHLEDVEYWQPLPSPPKNG